MGQRAGRPLTEVDMNAVKYLKTIGMPTGSSSAMQETKLCRTRARLAKEWQDFCEQAVCVSELENLAV